MYSFIQARSRLCNNSNANQVKEEVEQKEDNSKMSLENILKSGKARAIRFSTLELICNELNCTPGDILEYLPED